MLFLFDRKKKAANRFQEAFCLEKKAAKKELTDKLSSVLLYAQAYEIYEEMTRSFFLQKQIKGKAAYHMYCLAKASKVALDPIEYHGMMLTSKDRLRHLLDWSIECGYLHPSFPPSSTSQSELESSTTCQSTFEPPELFTLLGPLEFEVSKKSTSSF